MAITNFVQNSIACDRTDCTTAPFVGTIEDASTAGWTYGATPATPLAQPVAQPIHCPAHSA